MGLHLLCRRKECNRLTFMMELPLVERSHVLACLVSWWNFMYDDPWWNFMYDDSWRHFIYYDVSFVISVLMISLYVLRDFIYVIHDFCQIWQITLPKTNPIMASVAIAMAVFSGRASCVSVSKFQTSCFVNEVACAHLHSPSFLDLDSPVSLYFSTHHCLSCHAWKCHALREKSCVRKILTSCTNIRNFSVSPRRKYVLIKNIGGGQRAHNK